MWASILRKNNLLSDRRVGRRQGIVLDDYDYSKEGKYFAGQQQP